MTFSGEITEPPRADIEESADFIAKDSLEAARAWVRQLFDLIDSLSEMPERFSVISEGLDFPQTYRCAHHFSHRVVYRVEVQSHTVFVVRVYHGARQQLTTEDIDA